MNSAKSLRLSLSLLAALLLVAVTGCKDSERELLDTVPDSAQSIITMNLGRIMKSAGCQVKDGKYELTPDLADALGSSDAEAFVEWLGTFSHVIDIDHVVVYMLDGRNGVATVSVTDETGLQKALADYEIKKIDTRKGYDLYEAPNGIVLLLKDGQAWLARKADDVIKSVKEAEKNPVAGIIGVKEFLLTDAPLNFACRYNGISYQWMCGTVKLSDELIGLTLKGMDNDGKYLDFSSMLKPVNTDFLRYTPSNTQLAAAFSVPAGIPWDSVKAIVMAQARLSMAQKGVLEMLFEQLKKIDGTVALCAAPAAGSQALTTFNLASWDLLFMAHMAQDEVNSNVNNLVGMAGQFGLRVEEQDGVYHADLSSLDQSLGEIYLGNIDGYFAVSTRPFDSNMNNSLTQTFEGKNAAIAVDVPYGSETMKAFGLPYGFSVTLQVEDDAIEMRGRFNGTSGSFLSSLISLIAKNN